MINYKKVLELGLKHEPIENPEEYAWVQVDDEAICGAKLNGREANVPDFETEFNLMAVDFAEAIRAKFGEKCSILVLSTKGDDTKVDTEASCMFTGSTLMIAQALSATFDRNNELRDIFSLIRFNNILGTLNKEES
jgi:hypothetical protein